MIKFFIVGLSGTVIDYSIYFSLTRIFGFHFLLASFIGYSCGLINNFIWNQRWTFKDRGSREVKGQFSKFVVVNLAAMGLSNIFFFVLVDKFFISDIVARIITTILIAFFSFFANSFWTFREKNQENLLDKIRLLFRNKQSVLSSPLNIILLIFTFFLLGTFSYAIYYRIDLFDSAKQITSAYFYFLLISQIVGWGLISIAFLSNKKNFGECFHTWLGVIKKVTLLSLASIFLVNVFVSPHQLNLYKVHAHLNIFILSALLGTFSLFIPTAKNFLFKGRIVSFVVFFVVLSSYLAIFLPSHGHFATHAFDFGIHDQAVWKYSRFLGFENTVMGFKNVLGDHFDPIMMLLAPAYWVWDNARALLIAELLIVALGVFPVFSIAKRHLGNLPAIILSFVYAFSFGLINALDFPTHDLTLAGTFILFAFDFLERRKLWGYWIFIAFALLTKEDVSIGIAALGLYLCLFRKGARRIGIVTAVLATVYFFTVLKIVLPQLTDTYHHWIYWQWGKDPVEMLQHFIRNPADLVPAFINDPSKRSTIFVTGAWFGFLFLGAPSM